MLKMGCANIVVLAISVLTGVIAYAMPNLGFKTASDRFCYPKSLLRKVFLRQALHRKES